MGRKMKISGCHAAFYYCCFEHLLINMSRYITEALDQNELVYLSVENNLYHNLLFSLEEEGIREEDMELYSFNRLIKVYRQNGLDGCRELMLDMLRDAAQKGNQGITWIVQPIEFVRENPIDDVLVMQKHLTEAIAQTNISVLFIYDINHYLEGEKGEEEKLIEDSLQNVPYLLSEFNIKRTNDLF